MLFFQIYEYFIKKKSLIVLFQLVTLYLILILCSHTNIFSNQCDLYRKYFSFVSISLCLLVVPVYIRLQDYRKYLHINKIISQFNIQSTFLMHRKRRGMYILKYCFQQNNRGCCLFVWVCGTSISYGSFIADFLSCMHQKFLLKKCIFGNFSFKKNACIFLYFLQNFITRNSSTMQMDYWYFYYKIFYALRVC